MLEESEGEEEVRKKGNKSRKHKKKAEEKGKGEGYKICFWNVAGLENKDREFWEKLGEWDVMFLSETWLQEKGWERIKKWLPKGFIWQMQEAGKRNKKGRAMGGNGNGKEGGDSDRKGKRGRGRKRREEGIMMEKVNLGGKWWRLVGVYVNRDLKEKLEKLRGWMENREEGIRVLIGGGL